MSSRRKQRQEVRREESERRAPIKPLNPRQRFYLKAIDTTDMVVAYGPAGTAKTYLPSIRAAEMLDRGEIDKIILCRPAVEATEKLGALPGDLRRKMQPWVMPVLDAMEERLGKSKVDEFLKSERIQIVPFAYMRGRTFKRAFIILDEAQNTTPAQMKLFVTRLGQDSKTVVTGDVSQSDIVGDSGLAELARLISKYDLPVSMIRFTRDDVVRSGLCQAFVEAYESEAA